MNIFHRASGLSMTALLSAPLSLSASQPTPQSLGVAVQKPVYHEGWIDFKMNGVNAPFEDPGDRNCDRPLQGAELGGPGRCKVMRGGSSADLPLGGGFEVVEAAR